MSRKMWGLIVLLIGSEILGMLLGEWFFRLFLRTVPPLVMSTFNQGAAHAAFLFYGAISGLALFGWAVLAAFLNGLLASRPRNVP